jgi:4-amino-4-deoxy-L-arabinose transferase-like glycosyltransferase
VARNAKQQQAGNLPEAPSVFPNFKATQENSTALYSTAFSSTGPSSRLSLRLADLFVVLLIAVFFCLYGIGDGSFGDGDQTTHSTVVQQMVKHGDYLHPQYHGKLYYNKPPFKMWLATIPVRLFGESNFSYRVIDGLSGIGISLCVFLFAQSLFASRLAAYYSLFALLGARLFFFGHGVRNAVQDSMMLFLMTLGTILGWYFVEAVRRDTEPSSDSRRLWILAVSGGLFIGLAALTKNVSGYMAYVILGSYLLLSIFINSDLLVVVRRSWGKLLVTAAISFALPISYILAQGKNAAVAWQMLVMIEVMKRATQGYHFVGHRWYYWNVIVPQRLLVPPELLFAALGMCLLFAFRYRDRRYLFLFCWSLMPVLLQNAMKSKLLWYILPALPGMALAIGALMSLLTLPLLPRIREWALYGTFPRGAFLPIALAAAYGCGSLAYNNYQVAHTILYAFRRNATDEMVEDIRQYAARTGKMPGVVFYNPPKLASHEAFYWGMLPTSTLPENDIDGLRAALESGRAQFVISGMEQLKQLLELKPIAAYSFVPVRSQRRTWLLILSYLPDLLPRHFLAASRLFVLADHPKLLNYGFKQREELAGMTISPSKGPRSSLLIPSSLPYSYFGTDVTLRLASTLPAAEGKLRIKIYMNELPLGVLEDVQEGFHERRFFIPAGAWRSQQNLLSFVYEQPNGAAVKGNQQLVLYHSIRLALGNGRSLLAEKSKLESSHDNISEFIPLK